MHTHSVSASYLNWRFFAATGTLIFSLIVSSFLVSEQLKEIERHRWFQDAIDALYHNVLEVNAVAYRYITLSAEDGRAEAEMDLRASLRRTAVTAQLIGATDPDGFEAVYWSEIVGRHTWLSGLDTEGGTLADLRVAAQKTDYEMPQLLADIWELEDNADEPKQARGAQNGLKPGENSGEKLEESKFTGIEWHIMGLFNEAGNLATDMAAGAPEILEYGDLVWRVSENELLPALVTARGVVSSARAEVEADFLKTLLFALGAVIAVILANYLLVFRPMQNLIISTQDRLKREAANAVAADVAKSEFLANMSHEIRTPINGIMGIAQVLAKSPLDERQGKFLETLMQAATNLLAVINDILDFSQVEAGRMQLQPVETDISALAEDTATILGAKADPQMSVEFLITIAPELPKAVLVDAGKLRQVLINYLGNAFKFTSSGHVHLCVDGETRGDKFLLRCTVADTGCGISKADQNKVFNKFQRTDGSLTREQEGNGLGLAICERLITLMGGTVGVESELGKGSEFWFEVELPIVDGHSSANNLPAELAGQPVLVIEPYDFARRKIADQIAGMGLQAEAVPDQFDAIDAMARMAENDMPVGIVVVDASTMDRAHADLAAGIKKYGQYNCQILVMQTLGRADKYAIWGVGDHVDIIFKPVCPSQLKISLEKALKAIVGMDGGAAPETGKENILEGDLGDPAGEDDAPLEEGMITTGPLVMIVEDNLINQAVTKEMLTLLGYRYIIANDGLEAVNMFKDRSPQIILMDISMPVLDGYEATKTIRAMPGGGSPAYIIGMTAHAFRSDEAKCIASGMDAYLSKPTTYDDLGRLLGECRRGEVKSPQGTL